MRSLLASAVLVLAACGGSTGPRDGAAYVLVAVDGRPLPAVDYVDAMVGQNVVVGGRILLNDGRYDRSVAFRFEPPPSVGSGASNEVEEVGSYTLNGGTLSFTADANSLVCDFWPTTGERTGDAINLQIGNHLYQYVR